MSCATCEEPTDTHTLYCKGSCGQAFHITCLAKNNTEYKKTVASYIHKIPNLKWICDSCSFEMYTANDLAARLTDIVSLGDTAKDLAARLVSIVSFAENALTMLTPSKSPSQTGPDGKDNATNLDISASSSMSFQTTDDATQKTPQVSELSSTKPPPALPEQPAGVSNVTKRAVRHRSLSPIFMRSAKQPKIGDCNTVGTDHIANYEEKTIADLVYKPKTLTITDMVSKTKAKLAPEPVVTVKTNMIRSIYISPFEPSFKSSDLMGVLEREDDLKHIVPNIKCKKLVGRGKSVRFASFKLDVRRDQFEIIMAAAIWKTTGIDNFKISEFLPKPNVKASGPNASDQNPFANPPTARNYQSRPSKSQFSASSQPQRQSMPSYTAQHRPSQCQNFCNNDCINSPRTKRNRWPKRFDGNRRGYRPYNGQ